MNSTCLAFRMTCYVWPGKWISSKDKSINALLQRQGIWVSFSASDNFQSNFLGGVTYGILTQSRFTIYVPRVLSQKNRSGHNFGMIISTINQHYLKWVVFTSRWFNVKPIFSNLVLINSIKSVFNCHLFRASFHPFSLQMNAPKRELLMELWIYQCHSGFLQFWSNINLWTSYLS